MRPLAILLLPLLTLIAFAGPVVVFDQAFLYLPDAEMKKRIADPGGFINYAGLIQEELEPTFSSLPEAESVSIGLIVTIRTNRESKVWFSIKSGSLSDVQCEHIAARIEEIPVPDVDYGVVPIAFALRVWGAKDIVDNFPIAPEWAEFMDGSDVVNVIEEAWKCGLTRRCTGRRAAPVSQDARHLLRILHARFKRRAHDNSQERSRGSGRILDKGYPTLRAILHRGDSHK